MNQYAIMEAFPTETIYSIINLLSSTEFQSLASVSHRLQRIVEPSIWKKLSLTHNVDYRIDNINWTTRVHPYVRVLELKGSMVHHNMENWLPQFRNLDSLSLWYPHGWHTTYSMVHCTFRLHTLKLSFELDVHFINLLAAQRNLTTLCWAPPRAQNRVDGVELPRHIKVIEVPQFRDLAYLNFPNPHSNLVWISLSDASIFRFADRTNNWSSEYLEGIQCISRSSLLKPKKMVETLNTLAMRFPNLMHVGLILTPSTTLPEDAVIFSPLCEALSRFVKLRTACFTFHGIDYPLRVEHELELTRIWKKLANGFTRLSTVFFYGQPGKLYAVDVAKYPTVLPREESRERWNFHTGFIDFSCISV